MKETKLYVGLNDSVTLKQLFEKEQYVSVLKHVCASYHVPFSFSIIQGGYYHESGELSEENTLLITLLDINDEVVDEIAKDLCVFFKQESVLVSYGHAETKLIKELPVKIKKKQEK